MPETNDARTGASAHFSWSLIGDCARRSP